MDHLMPVRQQTRQHALQMFYFDGLRDYGIRTQFESPVTDRRISVPGDDGDGEIEPTMLPNRGQQRKTLLIVDRSQLVWKG